jgi:hypothetical protein
MTIKGQYATDTEILSTVPPDTYLLLSGPEGFKRVLPGDLVGESNALSRQTTGFTTTSLNNNESQGFSIPALGKSFLLFSITTDKNARVRLYSTAAYAAADLSRAIGTDPAGEHGLIVEVVTTSGNRAIDLSPLVHGANLELEPTAAIAANITNLSGAAATITATFTCLVLEP